VRAARRPDLSVVSGSGLTLGGNTPRYPVRGKPCGRGLGIVLWKQHARLSGGAVDGTDAERDAEGSLDAAPCTATGQVAI
jgi:hypothetical protein